MTSNVKPLKKRDADFRLIDLAGAEESFEEAFLAGMARREKAVPCRFLYDARGSALFDKISTLPEYYPTRAETAILKSAAGDIAALIGPGAALIELGSGSSVKTRILLDRMVAPAAYMPIDVSRAHLAQAARSIADDYPGLAVQAIVADYSREFPLPATPGRKVAFFPGSTIGNLDRNDARDLLALWRARLGPGGMMIVGVDLKKDPRVLEAAYDDRAGVTEAFIKNVLARANGELGADFDLARFDYDARWVGPEGRIEMHLASIGAQSVGVAGRRIRLRDGERIHVENSHKYGLEEFSALARSAGFSPLRRFVDPARLFCVHALAA